MIAMSLDESKKIQIEMLRALDKFCRENEIEYSLAYGTLIGAVRHKGFIPWDDDIDVTMTRDNFEKFLQLFSHEKYDLIMPMRSKRWEFFARIVDPNTVVKFDKFPISPFGVWITIFPVDERPNSEHDWHQMKKKVDNYATLARLKCSTLTRNWPVNIIKLITSVIFKPIPLKWVNNKILWTLSRYKSKDNKKKIVWVAFNRYETYPARLFDDYIDMPFEDINARAMIGYDEYLRTAYGDYMQLPPKEQQEPSHDFTAYYINVNR